MSTFDNAVSINPYFEIKDENMEGAKAAIANFCDLVRANEPDCLFYNFTFMGNKMCCREAYKDANAILAHLDNCGEALGEFLKIAELVKIELHGPAGELDKLKEPLADMNPDYYVSECGIGN
jgi:quinol monooxygenase YgiN